MSPFHASLNLLGVTLNQRSTSGEIYRYHTVAWMCRRRRISCGCSEIKAAKRHAPAAAASDLTWMRGKLKRKKQLNVKPKPCPDIFPFIVCNFTDASTATCPVSGSTWAITFELCKWRHVVVYLDTVYRHHHHVRIVAPLGLCSRLTAPTLWVKF